MVRTRRDRLHVRASDWNILTRLLTSEGWDGLYLRPRVRRNWRWWVLAWLIPPMLIFLGAVLFFVLFPQFFDPTLSTVSELLGTTQATDELPIGPQELVGVIWGVWHWPLILMGYNYPDAPLLGSLAMVYFTVIAGTFIGWVALRGESVWPAVISHAARTALAEFPLERVGHLDTERI